MGHGLGRTWKEIPSESHKLLTQLLQLSMCLVFKGEAHYAQCIGKCTVRYILEHSDASEEPHGPAPARKPASALQILINSAGISTLFSIIL